MGGAGHGRRWRAPKTPTLLDVLWVRGRIKLQNQERSLPRVLDSNPTSCSITDTRIVGGGIMSKRNLVIEEGSVEALARLQKQDEEFCRRLRAAIETGRECCPTTVFTEPCTSRPVSNLPVIGVTRQRAEESRRTVCVGRWPPCRRRPNSRSPRPPTGDRR